MQSFASLSPVITSACLSNCVNFLWETSCSAAVSLKAGDDASSPECKVNIVERVGSAV